MKECHRLKKSFPLAQIALENKDMGEFLKVQLSEIASLTDTDRKMPSQYFLSYIPVYVFIFFTLIMLD